LPGQLGRGHVHARGIALRIDPRVVHEHVEAAELPLQPLRGRLHADRIGHVELVRTHVEALAPQPGGSLVSSSWVTGAARYGRSSPGQQAYNLPADATVGAADQRHSPFLHLRPPRRLSRFIPLIEPPPKPTYTVEA